MKKLLKAVALATVMCMLLSTAAFAAEFGSVVEPEDKTVSKVISANVVKAGANEQVVLLIVDEKVTDLAAVTEADIMYIDQQQADSEGNTTFENILIKDTETVVDVYVGSAATNGPKLIAEGVGLSDVKLITIVPESLIAVDGVGAGNVKEGFAAALTVTIPESIVIDAMIWAFDVTTAEGESRRYSSRINKPAGEGALEGDVQFAVAFEKGLVGDNIVVNPETVGAIFLTGEGTEDELEHFTSEVDKAKAEAKKSNN